MMRHLSLIIAWLGVLALGGPQTTAPAAEMINENLAAQHGLTRAWYAQVQLDRNRGRVTHVVLADGVLLVQTSQAMVHALNAETGQTLWVVQMGTPGYPDVPGYVHGDYVAVINGSTLFILNRHDGKLLWQKKLEGSPSAGPGLSDRQVYVPMIDGLVYTYPLKPVAKPILKIEGEEEKKPAATADKAAAKPAAAKPARPAATGAKQPGRAAATETAGAKPESDQSPKEELSAEKEQQRRESLRLSQEFVPGLACPSTGQVYTRPLVTLQATGAENVAWTTSRGFLFMGKLFENHFTSVYRLTTGGPMSTEPTYLPRDANIVGDSGVIFGSSEDGFVYAIREVDGSLLWRFSTGEPIVERSVVIGLHVLVPTQLEGMYCLNAENGEQVWWTSGIRRFVAASKERLYTIDAVGRMVVLNARTGARLDAFDVSTLPIRLTNDMTDRIYLTTPTGLIQCLHERELREPIRHREVLLQERAKEAEQRASQQEAAKAQGAPATPSPTTQPQERAATPHPKTTPTEKATPPKKAAQPGGRATQLPKRNGTAAKEN